MSLRILVRSALTVDERARKALSECAQMLRMNNVGFFLSVARRCVRIFPKVFRGEGVYSVKLQLLPLAGIWDVLLSSEVGMTVANRLAYDVAFAFASMESERAFKEVAEKGLLSDIKDAFERTLHSVGRHQRVSPMKLTDRSFSFLYTHCEFMRAFRELGVPTATVGVAFCDADRMFWKHSFIRSGRPFTIIKPVATQANSDGNCSLEIAVKE